MEPYSYRNSLRLTFEDNVIPTILVAPNFMASPYHRIKTYRPRPIDTLLSPECPDEAVMSVCLIST